MNFKKILSTMAFLTIALPTSLSVVSCTNEIDDYASLQKIANEFSTGFRTYLDPGDRKNEIIRLYLQTQARNIDFRIKVVLMDDGYSQSLKFGNNAFDVRISIATKEMETAAIIIILNG